MHAMAEADAHAIAEADVVIFLVDGREGLTPQDKVIADLLRRSGRPLVLAVNKTEGHAPERVDRRIPRARAGHSRCRSPRRTARTCATWSTSRWRCVPTDAPTSPRPAEDDAAPHQGRDRRASQRRQVDAGQHAARRGARHRVRRARHHARLALSRLRSRRAPLHAHRHRGRAQARQGQRRRSRNFP